MSDDYRGWANFQTFLVQVHIANSPLLYGRFSGTGETTGKLAARMKLEVEAATAADGLAGALILHGLESVDWWAIAEGFTEEVEHEE